MAPIMIEPIEIIHDTDYLPDAQYFDCLHYTNEFTNTYAIKYCIQPKDINSFEGRINRNAQSQCEKGAIRYSFSSLFENGIHPNVVLTTFHSGIDKADQYASYYFRRQMRNSFTPISDDFVCK